VSVAGLLAVSLGTPLREDEDAADRKDCDQQRLTEIAIPRFIGRHRLGADAAKVVASEDVDEEVDVESMDETEAVPVTSRGAGLRPPAPSSVDPMGIPTRPTGAPAAMPVGDEADAVGEARLGPAVQVPDVVPVVPPSKTVANPVGVEVVPVVEAAPVAGAPKEACGIELLKPEQTARSLVERPEGVVAGEVPCGTISVAPRGIPVGATGAGTPTPSGEVTPRGEGVGAPPIVPTWAIAEPGQSASASIAPMMNRDISCSLSPRTEITEIKGLLGSAS